MTSFKKKKKKKMSSMGSRTLVSSLQVVQHLEQYLKHC